MSSFRRTVVTYLSSTALTLALALLLLGWTRTVIAFTQSDLQADTAAQAPLGNE